MTTTSTFGRFSVYLAALLFCAWAVPALPGAGGMRMTWTNNMLRVTAPDLPGGPVEIWYLEAFCRSGSTHRDWHETTVPHQTRLLSAEADGTRLLLETRVEPDVWLRHELKAGTDEVTFLVTATNSGAAFADVQWFQPCLRVDRFTGRTQEDYWPRCFLYTREGLRWLDKTRRSVEALYRGGQVYVPEGIDLDDVNPRPLSPDRPVNGLIGCVSADDRFLLATAWDRTQELFQGVIVCIHNDPRIGGLKPGESRRLKGKLYFMKYDPAALLERYHREFGE